MEALAIGISYRHLLNHESFLLNLMWPCFDHIQGPWVEQNVMLRDLFGAVLFIIDH